MPEVAGDAAILVDPFDVTAIRAAINLVISNRELRRELVRKGLMNIRRFTPDVIAQQYNDLYQEVYRKNGPLPSTRHSATT
jgi:glycosyltransferase involved in cell wall biosynthesis